MIRPLYMLLNNHTNICAPLWVIPLSYGEAKGKHKDGVSWPTFLEITSIASGCVVILKSAPWAKIPGKIDSSHS